MSEGIVYYAPSAGRLRVMRDGHNIIRREKIPKPVVLFGVFASPGGQG
jgi:hypothetical protein